MRLAALFIENHDYEFGGYTLNFGGHFYYEVKFGDGNTRITRRKNLNFIDDFFDESGTITNVSAIVGNNGSGKTTTIYDALKVLNENYQKGIAFWEDEKTTYINHYNMNLPKIIFEGGVWEVDFKQTDKQVGTIYYSPYLDHKLEAIGIDISADRYLREDLVNLDSTFDANIKVVISERLKRADYKRFISFQKSEFSEKITKKYGLFKDEMYRVVFTRHKINANTTDGLEFENTPIDFQFFLNNLFLQIREEYASFDRNVASDEERYELNKKQFKNLLLMDIFCLLIKLMERKNTFLREGHFIDKDELTLFLKTSPDAITKLKYWLNNYYYSKWDKKPLPDKEIIGILDFLYDYIDSLVYSNGGNFLNLSSNSLFFNEEKLNELLDLNENLLVALNKYYLQKEREDKHEFNSISDLQHFVSVEFADRRLSSGETALLNLYSRIYDYFSRHIINYQIVRKEEYYILFLDEADLGYHPSWKRSFIKSIIQFSSDFFSKLGCKVQIVFTTHDPLTLSDLPDSSVIYLIKEGEYSKILSNDDTRRQKRTFGANINELLADSFFIGDGLIGDFAKEKIQDVIDYINDKDKRTEKKWISSPDVLKKVIEQIGEPYLSEKLNDMFLETFPEFKNELEIKRLEEKIKQLKNGSNTDK